MSCYNPVIADLHGVDMEEIWKTIPGCPRFEASSLGQIRGTDPRTGAVTIRKQFVGSHGYLMVNVQMHCGKRKTETVHSLVCLAFVGDRPSGCDCCHKDGDRFNNCSENLRWDTRLANIHDQKAHGTFGFHGKRKLTDEQILEIISRIDDGDRISQIAKDYGVAHGVVSGINLGRYHADLTGRRRQDAKPKIEKQGRALTKQKVLEIAALLNLGIQQKDIAERYGVTRQNISDINTGKLWGWVTGKGAE